MKNNFGSLRLNNASHRVSNWLVPIFAGCLVLSNPAFSNLGLGQQISLRASPASSLPDRVEVTYEAEGKLVVRETGRVQTLPMKVQAKFVFFERRPEIQQVGGVNGNSLRVAIRWYETAETSGTVDNQPVTAKLRADRRLVALRADQTEFALWSLAGPLTRAELDLLRPTCGTVVLEDLLPAQPVQKGSKWELPGQALASLVGFDGLVSSDVEATLLEIAGDIARVEFGGKVEGASEAMSSAVSVKGRYQFSVSQGRMVWLGLAYHERRDPGPIAPGVDVVTKVAITIRPGVDCPQIADLRLVEAAINPRPEDLFLEEEPPGQLWRLHYDRRWHVTALTDRFCVLRYVDRGSYLAQCKIARANRPQQGMSLAQFQADIREALGKQFHRFVHASELRSVAGTPLYRVEAQGLVGDVPVLWIFYWIANPGGEALVLSFTVEQSLYERFAQADKQLVEGLKFRVEEVAARPR
ncbi:MAG: hypothetical protein NZ899_00125 [Thermoguttaceae bacterium]|nr:hypothetical protein [Thermoguttaceae bacterium]MDW8077303.1 hypothetical protein [Thermoguttaceae bacterium]